MGNRSKATTLSSQLDWDLAIGGYVESSQVWILSTMKRHGMKEDKRNENSK